jgi:hypothetical protein
MNGIDRRRRRGYHNLTGGGLSMLTKQREKAPLSHNAGRPVAKTPGKKRSARPAKKTKPRQPKRSVPSIHLAEPIPDQADIQKLLSQLEPADRSAVSKILQGLEIHLGSTDAARIWLVTNSPEFGIAPLEAIRNGKARMVQAVLEARWGPNPAYA